MSAEAMRMLARRWGCSVDEVGRRIGLRMEAAGLVDKGTVTTDQGKIAPHVREHVPAFWYTIGVTDDDRIFVLDEHDCPLLEL